MKEAFYRVSAWVTLIVGVVFFVIPIVPGIPLLFLSWYLFSLT